MGFRSVLVGAAGAFLKLGSLGFGFGAEKNDESDLASFTAVTTGFASFFTAGREEAGVRANFLMGKTPLGGGSLNFRFLLFEPSRMEYQPYKIFVGAN